PRMIVLIYTYTGVTPRLADNSQKTFGKLLLPVQNKPGLSHLCDQVEKPRRGVPYRTGVDPGGAVVVRDPVARLARPGLNQGDLIPGGVVDDCVHYFRFRMGPATSSQASDAAMLVSARRRITSLTCTYPSRLSPWKNLDELRYWLSSTRPFASV